MGGLWHCSTNFSASDSSWTTCCLPLYGSDRKRHHPNCCDSGGRWLCSLAALNPTRDLDMARCLVMFFFSNFFHGWRHSSVVAHLLRLPMANISRQFPRGSVSILVISAISNPYIEYHWVRAAAEAAWGHPSDQVWFWLRRSGTVREKRRWTGTAGWQNRSVLTCWIGMETRHLGIQSNQFMYTRVYMYILYIYYIYNI